MTNSIDDLVQRIKQASPIEAVIGEDAGFSVCGRGRYLTTREHDSLVIDTHQQCYFWNSAGENGDVINWVCKRRGLDFKGAVETLARRAGLPEPEWGKVDPQARKAARAREDALVVAASVLKRWLWQDPTALAYARGRGWTDETITGAWLGYSGAAENRKALWEEMVNAMGGAGVDVHSPAAVAVVGFKGNLAAWSNDYNVPEIPREWVDQGYIPGIIGRDMLVYPHIYGGRVSYLSLRGVKEKRHHNLPEPLVGARQRYFNLRWSSQEAQMVVVEGQADAITLGQWGIPAVALSGVAMDDHLIALLGADREETRSKHVYYVGLDADPAGKKGTEKAAARLGAMCRVINWQGVLGVAQWADDQGVKHEVKDANDLLRGLCAEGIEPERQAEAVQARLNISQTYAEIVAAWAGEQEGADRDAALRDAMAVICTMDELSRAQYQVQLSRALGITQREFARMVKTTLEVEKKSLASTNVEFTLGGSIDGWLVEYLYDPEEHRASLAWRDPNGKIGSGESVEIEGMKYEPMPPTDTFKNGGILFPSQLGQLKSTGELVTYIEMFISSVYLLSSRIDAKIMSYYALLTWIYDSFNTIPYLRAMGEAGAGKSELLRRVGLVCYRLMMANGAGTAASLFRSVERYRGTVFIDEADLQQSDTTNDIVKFLNLGAMRNNPIWRLEEVIGIDGRKEFVERMYTTFCPKLIAMRRDFKDDAVGSRSLTFKIQPRETMELIAAHVPLEINNDVRTRALALRNLLVRWRLEHWQPEIPVDPSFYDLDISSRLNQVTGPLMAVAADDPALQGEMRHFLREYYSELILTKSMTITARVIEALWKIHNFPMLNQSMVITEPNGDQKMLVGQVTKTANEIIDEMNNGDNASADEDSKRKRDELSPQRIGRLIREELQLRVSGRTNKGFYVYWDQIRMEALAKRYGINPEEIKPPKAQPRAAQPQQLNLGAQNDAE